MGVLSNLQPERVFYYFEEICKIPHGSRNTKAISDYLAAFAKDHGLQYIQDGMNNIIIFKDATKGYENSDPIIIQGHMDMVCEKDNGVEIDFEKDGLPLMIDGDFVTSNGTTLGGDDGVAVAFALAILEDDTLQHPALEIIITVDEEIGLLGAEAIDLSMLKGHKMLNLDSDEDGVFLTSCAGGMALNVTIPMTYTKQKGIELTVTVTGLQGGHSGAEIQKERGNANILMGRVLETIANVSPLGIIAMAGGLKDNAIPRECTAKLLLPKESKDLVEEAIASFQNVLQKEYAFSDPDLRIDSAFAAETEAKMLDFASVNKVIYYLRTIPNGVQHMSQVIPGLVETSLNLGILELKEDCLYTVTSVRSSVGSRKEDLKIKVCNIVEMLGGESEVEGDYPAWEYEANSSIRPIIGDIYKELTGTEARFEAIHAGLECGIFSGKIPNLDCVSFGPMNLDIHTPKERLNIKSTELYYKLVTTFLERAK